MNSYFITDDVITQSGREGFEVVYGNPYTACGFSQYAALTLRECKAFVALRIAEGETVYRVRLARRHGEHSVKVLKMSK